MNLRIGLQRRVGRWQYFLIACLGCQLLLLAASEDVWAIGELSQKPGRVGCISQNGSEGFCQDGNGLGGGPHGFAVSPDGNYVYVASRMGVGIFKRNPQTGELQQLDGEAGCIANTGNNGGCKDVRGLRGLSAASDLSISPDGITISPDGNSIYVAAGGLAIFKRNPQTGELAQLEGKAGCISSGGNKGKCRIGRGLEFPTTITISPDGTSVYVAGRVDVAIFQRNPQTGALRQLEGKAGCISENGSEGGCQEGKGLFDASGIATSPDGNSVYLTSDGSSAIVIFRRNSQTGALRQLHGEAGCISSERPEGEEGCRKGKGFDRPTSLTFSPDGTDVYVGSLYDSVAIFKRNPQTGELTQEAMASCKRSCLSGAYGIAISPDGNNVYTADNEGVATLKRNLQTGALAQLAGKAGCISPEGGECQRNQLLVEADSVSTSPDGTSVYVGSERGVLIFDRAR